VKNYDNLEKEAHVAVMRSFNGHKRCL